MNYLVVAMPAEARPLLRHFDLRGPRGGTPFRLYRGDDFSLVVSGKGRQAATQAVRWLHGLDAEGEPGVWLNVGIGGHRSLGVGTAVLADRLEDQTTGSTWTLPQPFEAPCRTGTVITVDEVERLFPRDAVYEMEAAGFMAATSRLTVPGGAQVLKVVSDNLRNPVEEVSADAAAAYIEASAGLVGELLLGCSRRLDGAEPEGCGGSNLL